MYVLTSLVSNESWVPTLAYNVLKEIVDKYRSINGGIYKCFIDASNAFDRVNHSVLFRKLIRRGIPGYIINILCYWYHSQTICVIWGASVSSSDGMSNDVRQGGILSPYLFNVYMDDLSHIMQDGLSVG